MKVVDIAENGVSLELLWMRLPTFIAINSWFLGELTEMVNREFVGTPITPDTVDNANRAVKQFIINKFPEFTYEDLFGGKDA